MLDQRIEYSEERGTWNLFVNNEWYYEGTYEQCSDMMFNNAADEYEDDYVPDDYDEEYEDYSDDYGYESNAPCDTYGPAACSSSCPNYAKCQGWEK